MTKIPKHKVVFIGDQGVGKSSLAGRFIYDVYEEKYQPTIGIDFLTRSVRIGRLICYVVLSQSFKGYFGYSKCHESFEIFFSHTF